MRRSLPPGDWSLVYVGDPMCSWCYGFAPSLRAVTERWPALPVNLVMGGLRPERVPLDDELKSRLRYYWRLIAKRTGQRFDERFLERRGAQYGTEPACRAVVAVREHDTTLALPMFRAMQRAFYTLGHDLADTETLTDLAQGLGLSRAEFARRYDSDDALETTRNDFDVARRWGITGFPTLLAVQDGRGQVVAPGWMPPDELVSRLDALMAD